MQLILSPFAQQCRHAGSVHKANAFFRYRQMPVAVTGSAELMHTALCLRSPTRTSVSVFVSRTLHAPRLYSVSSHRFLAPIVPQGRSLPETSPLLRFSSKNKRKNPPVALGSTTATRLSGCLPVISIATLPASTRHRRSCQKEQTRTVELSPPNVQAFFSSRCSGRDMNQNGECPYGVRTREGRRHPYQ